MKSHSPLKVLNVASGDSQSLQLHSPKKKVEIFAEKFITHHSKIDTVSAAEDNIRYLYNDVTALRKLKKMVSLYETIETDLQNKGIDTSVVASITSQEENIISLISEGLQTKQIAASLFISEHTVQTHRKNIYKKLNVTSVTDLVKISMILALN